MKGYVTLLINSHASELFLLLKRPTARHSAFSHVHLLLLEYYQWLLKVKECTFDDPRLGDCQFLVRERMIWWMRKREFQFSCSEQTLSSKPTNYMRAVGITSDTALNPQSRHSVNHSSPDINSNHNALSKKRHHIIYNMIPSRYAGSSSWVEVGGVVWGRYGSRIVKKIVKKSETNRPWLP